MDVVTIETSSLGDRSYLVHDGRAALVVDPQRDVDRVLAAADAAGLHITHVAETHLHNDYVSGGLVLARLTGAALLHAAREPVTFDHVPVADGESVHVGRLHVDVVHTPGHTAHHLTYVARDGDAPPAVFTGGSLLYGTVGRTDLVDEAATEALTRSQFRSARRLAGSLPEDARVYPTHGFDSFCASTQSASESDGTLGTERRVNIAFAVDDEDEFADRLVSGLSPYPAYYAHLAPVNLAGAGPADLTPPRPVDPAELARRIHRHEWVVDLRQRRAFARDHVAGTVGIELSDAFSTYLGWLIPWGTPLTLLGTSADEVLDAQRQLVRIGIDRPTGAATGDPGRWASTADRRGYRVARFTDLAHAPDPVVLDVRQSAEHADAHVRGSLHVPLHELDGRVAELPPRTLWVHCSTGFRSSIAASLLDRAGREAVLVDDDFEQAAACALDIVDGDARAS